MRTGTPNRDDSRRGVALVIVLGLLAIMTVLAVAFAIAMRIERLAARNFADGVRAEQLVHAALADAMAKIGDTMTNVPTVPRACVYPLWDTTSPGGDAMASGGSGATCADLFSGEASNAIPETLQADSIHAAGQCKWIDVKFTDPGDGKTYKPGRIAWLAVNASGLLDANHAGGTNRVHSVNLAEVDFYIDGNQLTDIKSDQAFFNNRTNYVRHETVNELAALTKLDGALNLPVKNLFTYSLDPGRDVYFQTNNAGEPTDVGTPLANLRPKFYVNDIENYDPNASGQYEDFAVNRHDPEKTFKRDYFDPLVQLLKDTGIYWKPKDVAWNIINWIDKDRWPAGDTALVPYLHTEGGEAMPYINEIMLKPGPAPNTCQCSVEVWWPFYSREPNALCEDGRYEIEIQACPTNPANPDLPGFGTSKTMPVGAMEFGTPTEFKQFESDVIAGTAAWIRVYTRYSDPLGRKVIVDGAVDRKPTEGYPPEELSIVKFTSSTEVSRQVSDPRSNGKIWYWRLANETLGRINENPDLDLDPSISHPLMKGKAVCDPWWLVDDAEILQKMPLRQGLPIHVRNGPMINIGELGYVFLSNRENAVPQQPQEKWFWSTIDLMDYKEGAFLLDHCTVRATNYAEEGFVSISTRQDDVLRALFHKMTLGDPVANQPMDIDWDRTRILVDTITQVSGRRPFISFQDIFNPKYQGDAIAREFKRVAVKTLANFAPGAIPSDKLLEDPFRNILDLITFRQNIFMIVLAAQAFGPDQSTVVAEKRAIATVFRDAYTGSYFIRSFKWLAD